MAHIKNGILGGFSGKVGAVVGYQIGDNFYIRTKPAARKHFTKAELTNQAKFKLVNNYLKPFKDLLKVGFKNYYTPTGGIRAAVAYTLKETLVSTDSGFAIDSAKFKISDGTLPIALNANVSLVSGSQLVFNWENSPIANGNDQLMVLVYDVLNAKAQTLIFDGPARKAKTLTLPLELSLETIFFDVYIGFVAADRSSQSESQYLGRITL